MNKRKLSLVAALLVVAGLIALAAHEFPKWHHHRVVLTWNAAPALQGVRVVGYNVYRSEGPAGPFVRIADQVHDTTYTDWVVNNGKTYFYVVRSVDGAGHESGDSNRTIGAIP